MKKILLLMGVTLFDTGFGYLLYSYFVYGNFNFRWPVLLWALMASLVVTVVFSVMRVVVRKTPS